MAAACAATCGARSARPTAVSSGRSGAATGLQCGMARRRLVASALSRRELLGSSAAAAALLPPLSAGAGTLEAAVEGAEPAGGPSGSVELRELRTETDANGVQRLALQPEGWNSWQWRGHRVNWLRAGDSGPVVLLVHGFGASVYHWRYNVPELAKSCRVYALDCLGFGWSDKPLVQYDGYSLWSDQIADFIQDVVGEPAVVAGNSLGGYNALATAARHPDLVRGVVLLNAAGRFEDASEAAAADAAAAQEQASPSLWARLVDQVSTSLKRTVVVASFVLTKQPARIRQVLNQVYTSPRNVDDDLVRSISLPAQNANAPEVFYRIITARGEAMNRLLDRLPGTPLFLLWGSQDPWCVPARATMIQQYYPSAERTDLFCGHCPHDDDPEAVNKELLRWVGKLDGHAAA